MIRVENCWNPALPPWPLGVVGIMNLLQSNSPVLFAKCMNN
jgi:hypothetical protein